jgi:hypothetical protein
MSTSRISDTARRTIERITGLFDRKIGERAPRPAAGAASGEGAEAARDKAAAGRQPRFAPDDTQ